MKNARKLESFGKGTFNIAQEITIKSVPGPANKIYIYLFLIII